jgi:DNA-binding IclR family transcriptional regulator
MQVVRNALRILEEVGRRQPVGLAELHRIVGLPKTTVHRTLVALAEAGWIQARHGAGSWMLAPRAVVLGALAASGSGLRDLALPTMERLRDATGESIHLTVPDGAAVVLIERLDSPRAVRVVNPLGTRAPMHASANGKAILAALPEAESAKRIGGALRRFTDATVTDRARLRAELARARADGFARSRGEFVKESAAVAAAVCDRSRRPIAAIAVSGPASRLGEPLLTRYGRLVATAAAEVSARLGCDGAATPAPVRLGRRAPGRRS